MRVRSSAAARRRSRSSSRSARRARSSSSASRWRRWRTWSPTTHAPPQTTTPNRIGVVGKPSCGDRGRADVHGEQAEHDGRGPPRARSRGARSAATKKRATVGPNGGPSRVAEPVQRGARRGGHDEDAERRAAAREQREGRERRRARRRAGRAPLRTVRADKQRERQRERDGRDDAVAQPRRMRDTTSPDRCVRDAHNSPLPTRVTSRACPESPRRRIRVPPWEDAEVPPGGVSASVPDAYRGLMIPAQTTAPRNPWSAPSGAPRALAIFILIAGWRLRRRDVTRAAPTVKREVGAKARLGRAS